MLRKVDCVMIRVDSPEVAAIYYRDVFGLRPNWSDDVSIGFKFPESDTEIVLHNDPNIPSSVEVYYLVRDVIDEMKTYTEKGCELIVAPFDIRIGKCAVIKDPFGTRLCILDMTKGCRPSSLVEPGRS
jgi:lactoylglutathione lyase